MTKPVLLCILDGWGCREATDHNALAQAKTPHLDAFTKRFPMSRLEASELDVGLPTGQMGNSEVGHMNIGSGRVIMQDLPRIDRAIADGTLAKNPALQNFIASMKSSGGRVHLMGLLSDGGVHSHQDHLVALAKLLSAQGLEVLIHTFLDGRDTSPKSAISFLEKFEHDLGNNGQLATISGRYYAMDRDQRWERVKQAFDAITVAYGHHANNWREAIEASYKNNVTDEFVIPCALGTYRGMKDGDGIVMGNFRADRAREILAALLDPNFKGFPRNHKINFAAALGLTEYSTAHNAWLSSLFPPEPITDILGEVISRAGLKQLRIAETEKYAHVTFFFNGGREEPFPGEERILVPSPKVATYDLKPEMSAPEVTDKLVEAIASKKFDLIVANYANADMVGHTGIMSAAIKAVETLDACMGRLYTAIEQAGGIMLITADHGNIEQMHDPDTAQAHTAHTLNPVPCILMGPIITQENTTLKDGKLADIAPTILSLMNLPQPASMTGTSLLSDAKAN